MAAAREAPAELSVVRIAGAGALLPAYASEGAAGLDICIADNATLAPRQRTLVPTGLRVAIPQGHVGILRARSSLAVAGVEVGAGVIDSDYRGELRVLLINMDNDTAANIPAGSAVAQLIVLPVATVRVREVDALDNTPRGAGGFGSTGAIALTRTEEEKLA